MDRDELQDRIRARRSGADPYRRGGTADEGTGPYQRYEPEPDDARARRTRGPDGSRRDAFDAGSVATGGAAAASAPRPDITRDTDDWESSPAPEDQPPPASTRPAVTPVVEADEPERVDNYAETVYDDESYPYEYDEWDDGRDQRSSGAGAFAILGFLALGVLALLGGAVLAGVFSSEPNVGGTDPTQNPSPTIQETVAPSITASVAPSVDASVAPSAEPPASGEPVVFPDGFTAEAQPCVPGSVTLNGCDSNGANNGGQVEIWVGFQNGTSDDVVGASIVDSDGGLVGDGSVDLASIRCGATCNGYTFFPFSGLAPGTYEVQVTRNGEPASSTSFEVS